MQLKLTWRIKGQRDMELLVFEEQKIAETMEILLEKGFMGDEVLNSVEYIKALRTNNQVNVLLTYKEANIYSGDILVLENNQDYEGGMN